jgi:hypothetical protein
LQRRTQNFLAVALLFAGTLVLAQAATAQDDSSETPLGDVARSFRKKTASSELVIDNDNFSKVLEDGKSRRVAGSTLVFSLNPGGKGFRVSAPDVSCSLSFSAKSSALLADPAILDEIPRDEIAKLDGPATIDGDSLQVSIHNGTSWELREVVIGLTIVRSPDGAIASRDGAARIMPAVAGGFSNPMPEASTKQPDVTVLLRVKGSAAPAATALFRTQLNFALFPDQEWHWAIVRAKGVPPPNSLEMVTMTDPTQGATPTLPPAAATASTTLNSNPNQDVH